MTQQNYKRGTKPLPERFVLVPTIGSTLQVMHAAQCVGYLWLENDTWRAHDDAGALIDSSGLFKGALDVCERITDFGHKI